MVSLAAVGLMVITVLVGVLLNSSQVNRLGDRIEKIDAKIGQVESSLNSRIDRVESSLNAKIDKVESSLNAKIDKLDARLDKLDAKVDRNWDASHRDALEIMRQMTSLHERVAVVESKSNG